MAPEKGFVTMGSSEEFADREYLETVGARFSTIRGLAYLGIGDLAELTGYPAETWEAVEAGRHDMTVDEARAACDAMGVDIDFLMAYSRESLAPACKVRAARTARMARSA